MLGWMDCVWIRESVWFVGSVFGLEGMSKTLLNVSYEK